MKIKHLTEDDRSALKRYMIANTVSWGRREYPLFHADAKDLCPSARFVGGVSQWLCECRTPVECLGVQKAAATVYQEASDHDC